VRLRILAAIVVVSLLAVTALAVPLSVRLAGDDRTQATARLEREAASAGARVPAVVTASTRIDVPDLASQGDLAIYDTTGHRIGGEGPAIADAYVRRALTGHTVAAQHGGAFVVGLPVVRNFDVVAAVRGAEPMSVVATELRRQRLNIVLFAAAALVMALGVGLWLSSRLARPLARLSDAAGHLGSGDFTSRAPRSGIAQVDDVAQALDDTANRLSDLVERERSFSAHASHQLRTPLTSLRLAIEAELARPRDDASTALAEMLVQVDRLEGTIRELLALARGTADRGPVELADLVYGAVDRWRDRYDAVHRPLQAQVFNRTDVSLTVTGSLSALSQILDVLLDNALVHGGGAVVVVVRAGGGGGVVVAVEDEGAGIDGDLDTLVAISPHQGHGYGLQLAMALAHAEGAELRFNRLRGKPAFELMLVERTD
jgi:signal transduction histidine kinase